MSDGHPEPHGKVLRDEDTHTPDASEKVGDIREEVADQQLEAHERNLTNLPPSPGAHVEIVGRTPAGNEKKRGMEIDRLPRGGVVIDSHGAQLFETPEELAALQRHIGNLASVL